MFGQPCLIRSVICKRGSIVKPDACSDSSGKLAIGADRTNGVAHCTRLQPGMRRFHGWPPARDGPHEATWISDLSHSRTLRHRLHLRMARFLDLSDGEMDSIAAARRER